MYDRHVTARAVEETSRKQGWQLKYHSLAEIQHATRHFEALWDGESGRLSRALRPDEAQFIQNERKLCALDFRGYWLPNYAHIVNYEKRPVRFKANVAQEIVMDLWAEKEAQGLAIWMQQLKARRLGVSTISELAVQHRFQFHEYTNAVVASADPGKTLEMAGMIKFCLDQQPWWLIPQEEPKIKSGLPVEFPDIHTSLTIQAGNQFTGVARGATPNVFHGSELIEWRDPEDSIDGALMRAIIDSPNVFGIMESTGGPVGSWWHRTWEQNKRDYARGRARVTPVFLPWYVGTDLYPSRADLLARPIPSDWIPSDRTIAHAERARLYVLSNPLLFRYLAKGDRNWKMSREQMWFREIEYETAKEKKQLNIFLVELCADDFEAFQSSAIPVIDTEILMGYQERTRPPKSVYTIIGPDIPPTIITPRRYWDPSKPTLTISTREIMNRFDVKYQLVPLLFEGYPNFDESMKLLVWEFPRDGQVYGVGIDCSEGLGQDNTVMEVLREATPMEPPGQVAEWASDAVTAFQLWPLAMALGVMYSTVTPQAGRRIQCRMAIESQTNGSAVQNELQKRGWINFHPRKYNDTKKPRRDADVAGIGILTNQWFRSTMMDMMVTSLSEEAIDIPSPYLIQELMTLERGIGETKAKAAYGSKDDRIMGLGFPLFSLHMNKPPSRQFTRKRVEYAPGLQEQDGIVHPIWTPPEQAQSHAFSGRVTQRLYRDPKFGHLERAVNPGMPKGFR